MKRCHLCSRFFSKLKTWLCRLLGRKICCRCIHVLTQTDPERVISIDSVAPDCACERVRVSRHSPGVVGNGESLSRFVFDPIHIDKKGRIKPTLFSHVHNAGCSIQRESIASNVEIKNFVVQFLRGDIRRKWVGVVSGDCGDVRNIVIDGCLGRIVCVLDTGNRDNAAHAEMCKTRHSVEEADRLELHRKLLLAFGGGQVIQPQVYRNATIHQSLPADLR
jgi:hypothetical protein